MLKLLAALLALLTMALPAQAGPAADAAMNCLADNTTGKERKELAKWVFLAMSAHPEIRDHAAASAEAKEQSSRYVGELFTRLLSANCAREIRAASASEGPVALQRAFEALGRLAMQELMADKEVTASMVQFERFVDRAKVAAALEGK